MAALILPVATPASSSALPSLDALSGLDATALAAVADALLAAAAPSASAAAAAPADPAAAATPPPAAGAGGRPRRRRGPVDGSPAGLAAREALITQHLPLVRYVTRSMTRHVGQNVLLDYDDLLSYGTEGLIAAVDSFDAARGLKFSTWAVMHIRTTVQDALRTLDPLPRSLRAKGKAIDRVASSLAHERGEWPELPEVAAALGQPLEAVRKTLDALSQTSVSLEQADSGHHGASTGGDEAGFSLMNLLADDDPEVSPEETLEQKELSRLLAEAVTALPPREEVLIRAHYYEGRSMREIARMLGVSESRISQLHARAVKLLREQLHNALSLDPVPPVRRPARRTPLAYRRPIAIRAACEPPAAA